MELSLSLNGYKKKMKLTRNKSNFNSSASFYAILLLFQQHETFKDS